MRVLDAAPFLILLLAGLAGCVGSDHTVLPSDFEDTIPDDDSGTRFLVIGDGGTGGAAQARVAGAMRAVCAVKGCDLAVHLGDNIYPDGASDAYDDAFETKFEQPYAGLDLPFLMVLGNHDVRQGNGEPEIAYSHRGDRSTDRWFLPDRWYSMDAGGVVFYTLDTTAMAKDFTTPDAAQADWLDDALARGDGWRIVLGHHPYVSNGVHGDAGEMDGYTGRAEGLHRFYQDHVCGKADLILSGHDHDLQWLRPTDCDGTEQIVSGAAGKQRSLRSADHAPRFQVGNTYGFFYVWAGKDRLVVQAYDDTGALLYDASLSGPRGP